MVLPRQRKNLEVDRHVDADIDLDPASGLSGNMNSPAAWRNPAPQENSPAEASPLGAAQRYPFATVTVSSELRDDAG